MNLIESCVRCSVDEREHSEHDEGAQVPRLKSREPVCIGAEFVILPGMRKVYDVKIETLPFDYVRYSEDEEINYILTTNHYIRCNPKFDSQMYKFFVTIVHMRAHLQVQSAIYHKIVA